MTELDIYKQLTTQYKEIIEKLNVLIVEDDLASLYILKNYLSIGFNEIFLAKNAMEALNVYEKNKIDLIITDNIMPLMSGLEMLKEIKQRYNYLPPTILVTAFIDTDYLIDCINIGIIQFLVKPINKETLYKAIEYAIKNVIIEKLNNELKDKELELLKIKEEYFKLQQELALKKEKNIIIHDLFLKRLNDNLPVVLDSEFIPHDVLSGDAYSIRKLDDYSILIILVDGMGKGLSAAITTLISISYLNNLVDTTLKISSNFDLKAFVETFLSFIKKNLLSDEILSASFVYMNYKTNTLKYSIFSNPPIYIKDHNSNISVLKSNNLPISKYIESFKVDEYNLENFFSIFITSDGLTESFLNPKEIYQKRITIDIKDKTFLNEFKSELKKLKLEANDDVTLIMIYNLSKLVFTKQFSFTIESKLNQLIELSSKVEKLLIEHIKNEELINTYLIVFTELLMNAYEHGSLQLDYNFKFNNINRYEELTYELEKNINKKIFVTLNTYTFNEKKILETIIKDEGNGLNIEKLTDLLHDKDNSKISGRGIYLSKKLCDLLYYNSIGNEVKFYYVIS